MTANEFVVNTNEFFCVPVGKSRPAAILETSSDLGYMHQMGRGHRRPRHLCLLSILFCEMPRHDEGRRAIHEDRVGVSQQDLRACWGGEISAVRGRK